MIKKLLKHQDSQEFSVEWLVNKMERVKLIKVAFLKKKKQRQNRENSDGQKNSVFQYWIQRKND